MGGCRLAGARAAGVTRRHRHRRGWRRGNHRRGRGSLRPKLKAPHGLPERGRAGETAPGARANGGDKRGQGGGPGGPVGRRVSPRGMAAKTKSDGVLRPRPETGGPRKGSRPHWRPRDRLGVSNSRPSHVQGLRGRHNHLPRGLHDDRMLVGEEPPSRATAAARSPGWPATDTVAPWGSGPVAGPPSRAWGRRLTSGSLLGGVSAAPSPSPCSHSLKK